MKGIDILSIIGFIGGIIAIVQASISLRNYLTSKYQRKNKLYRLGFDSENTRDLNYYIRPTLIDVNSKICFNSKLKIQNYLINRTKYKITYLIGDAGIGKSLFLAYLAKNQKMLAFTPRRTTLRNYSYDEYKNPPACSILLLIDAIEEQSEISISDFIEFEKENLLRFGKVIIAMRQTPPINLNSMISKHIDVFSLSPFNSYQVKRYLLKKYGVNFFKIISAVRTININQELFGIPLFLKYIDKFSKTKKSFLNKNDLFDEVIKSFLDQHDKTLVIRSIEIYEEIAISMYNSKEYQINELQLNNIVNSIYPSLKIHSLELLYQSNNHFHFIHFSFYEYFIAKSIIENKLESKDVIISENINENIIQQNFNFLFSTKGRFRIKDSKEFLSINESLDTENINNITKLYIRPFDKNIFKFAFLGKLDHLHEVFLIHEYYTFYLLKFILYQSKNNKDIVASESIEVNNLINNLIECTPEFLRQVDSYYHTNVIVRVKALNAYYIMGLANILRSNKLIREETIQYRQHFFVNDFPISETETRVALEFLEKIVEFKGCISKSTKLIFYNTDKKTKPVVNTLYK